MNIQFYQLLHHLLRYPSIFRGLKELRVKESDRLNLIFTNLQNVVLNCKIENNDLFIYPSKNYVKDKNIKNRF